MKNKSNIPVEIFTDGSVDRLNDNGGYGVLLLFGYKQRKIKSIPYKKTSIYRMELKAIIRALEEVSPGYDIYIYSDSKNAVDFINNKLVHTESLGILGRYPEHELFRRFLKVKKLHSQGNSSISISWIRAHSGNKNNEIADKLAGEAARGNQKVKCNHEN